jgi:hypothetical protein
MTGPRVTTGDVRGIYAIMPTPALPGADDPAAASTVDHAETARAVRALADDGVDAIMTTGTFGECATLTWDELRSFAETAVAAAGGRVPLFAGATTLNTRDTIARARVLRDLGVSGLLLGRPMWCYLDDAGITDYYMAVAEAVPELAIVVYDNPEAFKGKISAAAYRKLAALPQVIAAKYTSLGPSFADELAAMDGRMRALPVDRDWFTAWEKAPDEITACWSGSASCGPRPRRARHGTRRARRPAARLRPGRRAPFYGYPCRAGLTTTYCGVRVSYRLQVLNAFGEPIGGLYAAGEVVGGFHGAGYLTGTGLGKKAVFGMVAGTEVAGLRSCQRPAGGILKGGDSGSAPAAGCLRQAAVSCWPEGVA